MTKAEAFARLGKSKFRSRFRLTAADRAYVERILNGESASMLAQDAQLGKL